MVSRSLSVMCGGKLADKHGAVSALKFIFAALVVLLLVFQLTASVHYAALATVLVMGIFAFGNVPGLQVYVVQKQSSTRPAPSTSLPARILPPLTSVLLWGPSSADRRSSGTVWRRRRGLAR